MAVSGEETKIRKRFKNPFFPSPLEAQSRIYHEDSVRFDVFQLLQLKTVSLLFPTSDMYHHVVTPTMLLMSQLITQVSGFVCRAKLLIVRRASGSGVTRLYLGVVSGGDADLRHFPHRGRSNIALR